MINCSDLRMLVIRPTLQHIGLWSQAAENLLLGTAIMESSVGTETYLKQIKGPALGLYQIEPATHQDGFTNFLNFPRQNDLRNAVLSLAPPYAFDEDGWVRDAELIGNLPYATAIARIKYFRDPDPLPSAGDVLGLGKYYKRVFNSVLGAGTAEEWARRYEEYCDE